MENMDFVSITELAKIMNLSRVQVFRKIKAGQIPARKVGCVYVIPKSYADSITGEVTMEDKKEIEKSVKKTIKEYGEVIKKLKDE